MDRVEGAFSMGSECCERRAFLVSAGGIGAGVLLAGCAPATAEGAGKVEEAEVSPVEDLMREHGVLRRSMFVYDEISGRIERQEPVPLEVLAAAAGIVRRFVEDYHEKLEEDFVFPRFEKANRMTDLVAVLRLQHQAGRRVTTAIQALAKPAGAASAEGRASLLAALRAFVRMYGPHSAREDTVLFPELRALVGAKEYDALGDAFEDEEHARFGPRGFEGIVVEVAQLERALGIHDLAKFTPP
jgi:hemerythrin-like domain-containing protein